jgi:stage V sporulation protein AA
MRPVLYIKAEKNIEITHAQVTVGDILELECKDEALISKIKPLKIFQFQKNPEKSKTKRHRTVVSVLKIISLIHKSYPDLEIQNIGETDVIITYESQKGSNIFVEWIKVGSVVLITFVGSAFSIMTFSNDVQLPQLFQQIYEWVMGTPKKGFSLLELSYSIGLVIGIFVFFNHFGRKRFSEDPTPIEVEMRLYENDLQTTIIETYSRKGEEIGMD